MANLVTLQTLVDGERNTVIKFEGVLDTSDVAATGQVGASGFTTTLGSRTITFVAGALPPTVGQYLTFSDSVTTFPLGTYITSIVSATSVIVNNAALANNTAAAITITGTAGAIVIADPAFLSKVDTAREINPTSLVIKTITHNVEDLLSVNLFWEATANTRVEELTGRGHPKYRTYGGLVNNAGAGKTGRLLATTQGWTTSAILSFSVVLELVKS